MSVTAVPLHPVPKGTVPKFWIGALVLVLLGVGLAWLGTSRSQFTQGNDGIRYRVWDEGRGEPVTAADVARAEIEQRTEDGATLNSTRQSGGQLVQLFSDAVPTWMRPLLLQMRDGGAYQVFVPVETLAEGRPIPPDAPIKAGQSVEFRIKVYGVDRGGVAMLMQQQQQQMMQQQMMQQQMQGGPGGAGGPPALDGRAPPPTSPRGRR